MYWLGVPSTKKLADQGNSVQLMNSVTIERLPKQVKSTFKLIWLSSPPLSVFQINESFPVLFFKLHICVIISADNVLDEFSFESRFIAQTVYLHRQNFLQSSAKLWRVILCMPLILSWNLYTNLIPFVNTFYQKVCHNWVRRLSRLNFKYH